MVVAEIPLWVIHQNASTTAATASAAAVSDPAHGGVGVGVDPHEAKIQQAQRSLSLLLPSGTTNKNAKCAIYSVDVHPDGSIFATAGGDGTVRIWNVDCLFAGGVAPNKIGSKFDETTGAYVSSSSSSDDAGNSSSSNSENGDTVENGKKTRDDDGNESASSSSSSSVAQPEEVHDLNAVVRRKKGGAAVASSPIRPPLPPSSAYSPPLKTSAAAAAAATATATSSPRHTKHKSHHQHHHHHRLLCTLSAHTGSSVLCVRFSTTGKYLASAGDDACVCIYAPKKGAPASGNLTSDHHHGTNALHSQQQQQQHWARILLCRGHGLDVVDLAWAPDDSHLVSCSLDSNAPICVWKMGTTSSNSMIAHPFQILGASVHTSTVKGVTFDPAGSYLASSGDDPAVCIWRAHDDWGLEARIDAQTGIFRSWKDNDVMTSQSLFRRISWSTDGAFVCSTNSVVKNKHVASTIAREGWAVSGGGSNNNNNSGAANLVGHKQPVVVSRHAPRLLDARKRKKQSKNDLNNSHDAKQQASSSNSSSSSDDENAMQEGDEDDEPEHATLLALGDRRGFVTVWSTRKSRPLFKLQCSGESRCTVTDLSWGVLPRDGHLVLLVSLLDGHLVALRFQVPDEMGALLSREDHARVFQLRYGIDLHMDTALDGGEGERRLVGGTGPKLIENALQMTLEDDLLLQQSQRDDNDMDVIGGGDDDPFATVDVVPPPAAAAAPTVQQQVVEISSKGKKRVRPVLLSVDGVDAESSRPKAVKPSAPTSVPVDPLQHALDVAEKASAAVAAESRKQQQKEATSPAATRKAPESTDPMTTEEPTTRSSPPAPAVPLMRRLSTGGAGIVLPHSTERVHSADLLVQGPLEDTSSLPMFVAECVNVMKVPKGSKGASLPCLDLSISQAGRVTWKDQIPGTFCSAVTASRQLLAVGMADGSIQLWGTSPTLGWASGSAFRSHPALVVGSSVVSLRLKERRRLSSSTNEDDLSHLELLVVTADGAFAVYTLMPDLRLVYKGSLLPAMMHMSLGCMSSSQEERPLPKLSRIQITDRGRLFLLLSLDSALQPNNLRHLSVGDRAVGTRTTAFAVDGGAGGSLQAFVYDRASELWLRIADSRFVLSDFYTALPTSSTNRSGSGGILSKMDDAVRLGSLQSSLKPSHRSRLGDRQTETIYNQLEDDGGNFIDSRSHCEDRMACAVALESASEFKQWLLYYVRTLAFRGNAPLIRTLVDLLLGARASMESSPTSEFAADRECIGCWWLSAVPSILNLDRVALVRTVIIPELSKNRSLQRLTNEIAIEIDNQG